MVGDAARVSSLSPGASNGLTWIYVDDLGDLWWAEAKTLYSQFLDTRELAQGGQFDPHFFLALERFHTYSLEGAVAILEVDQVHLRPEIE
jgi:hypothetical protein